MGPGSRTTFKDPPLRLNLPAVVPQWPRELVRVETPSPEAVQGRQPVWSRGRLRGVFAGGGGGHPPPAPAGLLPPPTSAGDDGTIRESHGFLRGRLGGGRAESTEAGTLGDAHDSALGKGALRPHLPPPPHPGARLCGRMLVRDNCLLALHLLLPQGCSPQSSRKEARVTMATVCPDAAPSTQGPATTAPS